MKAITCIVCPNGCRILCENAEGEYRFSGNRCHRGAEYALSEITRPMRTLTTTVRTDFPGAPALPVRTNAPVPKERVRDVMRALRNVCVHERLDIGDVVVPRILGLEADVVCTSRILHETERRD